MTRAGIANAQPHHPIGLGKAAGGEGALGHLRQRDDADRRVGANGPFKAQEIGHKDADR